MPYITTASQVGNPNPLGVSEMAVGACVWTGAPTLAEQLSRTRRCYPAQTCCKTGDSILPSEGLNFVSFL